MYAVKDNRISLMERMMELGCDLTTVNKVPNFIHFIFIWKKKKKRFLFLAPSPLCQIWCASVYYYCMCVGGVCMPDTDRTFNDSRQQVMIIFYGVLYTADVLSFLNTLSIKQRQGK
jgi:hypothetical protein